ncbi:MAG: hypothetical protein II961_08885 [Candidatus Riflebacteria bacterium]|nr:hypothetical protein [Candidatus Riflebacteria bacterium]
MKKFAFIFIFFVMIFSVLGCDVPQSKSKSRSRLSGIKTNLKPVDKKLTSVKNIDYEFYEIYPSLQKYINTESDLKEIYSDDKKIVCYWYGMNCPYGNAFSEAMKKFKDDEKYKESYYFRPKEAKRISITAYSEEEMQIKNDYMLAKGSFCIFNPEKNQVLTIHSVGNEEAASIKLILDELLWW